MKKLIKVIIIFISLIIIGLGLSILTQSKKEGIEEKPEQDYVKAKPRQKRDREQVEESTKSVGIPLDSFQISGDNNQNNQNLLPANYNE